jgi:purine-cytosine permease-like protein
VKPVPVEQRQDTKFSKIFFVWFSANVNILSFSAGALGPAVFGLNIRDSCLTILLFELAFCAMPAYTYVYISRSLKLLMKISLQLDVGP